MSNQTLIVCFRPYSRLNTELCFERLFLSYPVKHKRRPSSSTFLSSTMKNTLLLSLGVTDCTNHGRCVRARPTRYVTLAGAFASRMRTKRSLKRRSVKRSAMKDTHAADDITNHPESRCTRINTQTRRTSASFSERR